MQRNQWPLRYKASQVRAAALSQEACLRERALDLRHQAVVVTQDPSEYCQSCGQPKQAELLRATRRSSDPLRDAKSAEAKADEYGKWAQALSTRGEDTLALHFDDAEYFGLLVEDAEILAKTGDAKGAKQLLQRSRTSGLGEES
jgi:hypothetical protein